MTTPELPTFRFTHVRCTRPDSLVVRWALNPTAYPLDDVVFEVFRSQGENGPWDLIGTADPGTFTFYDFEIEGPMGMRQWYYLIRLADTKGKGFVDSKPVFLTQDPDNIALEMIRKKNVFMTVKSGVAMAALLRRQWGAKCTRCWHPQRQLPADADCPLCYGTGYAGGYCNPILMTGMLPSPRTRMLVSALGRTQPNEEYFELSNEPWINVDDVIVDRTIGKRYRVVRVTQNTHRGYPVSQLGIAVELDDNHVVYNILIPETTASIGGRSWDLIKA